MINVAISTAPLRSGHKTRGIGAYTRSLLESLKKRSDIRLQELTGQKPEGKVDVVHYPFFDLFRNTLPFIKKFSTVVTIHDVTPLVFPRHYPPGIKGSVNNMMQRFSLKNVKALITDSEASKKDIEKFLKVDPKKIYPVYLAPGKNFQRIRDLSKLRSVSKKYNLPDKFLIYAGSVNWNKNLLNLTRASLDAGVDIVLVGKDFEDRGDLNHPEREDYARFLKEFSDNPSVHVLGFVPEEDLVCLINLSEALLLPSFYEGFGLPILEAQACGVPVITGNVSSMPEIAGKGALLVDPYSVGDIKTAIENIIHDKKIKDDLIEEGFRNVRKFSWEKTVEDTIKVYGQAVK